MVMVGTTRQHRWASAPLISLQALAKAGPILVVAPHPDDETIGCGGLICEAIRSGIVVHVATLTDGAKSHPNSVTHPPQVLAVTRRAELHKALRILGVPGSNIHAFDRPDGQLKPHDDLLVAALAELVLEFEIASVFCTWGGDSHPDHRATHDICAQSAAQSRASLWAYPVWGKLHDSDHAGNYADGPASRLSIEASAERKMAALACHVSQLGGLIHDDPTGFALSGDDLQVLTGDYEVFIRVDL